MSQRTTILVVDDEAEVRQVLAEYLGARDYDVIGAANAAEARALLARQSVDLALIDIHMPGEDGLSLSRHARERYPALGIVMLTSASTVVDRIVGLEVGADDYVSKPFDPRELLARIKSVLRRAAAPALEQSPEPARRVRMGRCVLDLAAHRLFDENGAEVPLSALEFDLLKAFAEHPDEALSRERILNLTREREWEPFDRSVDLRVMRLRKKIEPDPQNPRYIRTIRNSGYVFLSRGDRE
jgi:two-component system phosphate regulon response regulator OmpR